MATHDYTSTAVAGLNGSGKTPQPTPWKTFSRIGMVFGFIVTLITIIVMYQSQLDKTETNSKEQERRMIKLEDKVDNNAEKNSMEIKHLDEKFTIKFDTLTQAVNALTKTVDRHTRSGGAE